MERTKCQLCTWLTDSLSSNHTDSLTLLYHTTGSKVTAVALHADTLLRLTGKYRTNLNALDIASLNRIGNRLCDLLTCLNKNLTGLGVDDIMNRYTTQDTLTKTRDNLIAALQCRTLQTTKCTTVFLGDNHIVRNVNESTCQITSVGSLHGGVGQTLTGTVSRDKVLKY